MKKGDRVRLRQPFRPKPNSPDEYSSGIITALAFSESEFGEQTITGVLLQLYNPETLVVYKDELETEAVFYFDLDEIETH